MFAGWDPVANRASITVADPDWVARDQHRADGAFALAKELREVPDTAPERPTKFDELIQQTLEQPTLKTWAASYAVAAGLTFPLYSDDRYVRVLARREGIASFGTVAVLEALVERGRLQPEELAVARRRLRASGALGIPAAQQELIDEAAAADWDITDSIRQSLLDPAAWRPVDAGIRRHVALLRAVFENDPSRFRDWVIRVLDAIHITHPREHLNVHAYLLLAAAWASESSEFVQAMIKALRTVPLILGVRSLTQDPVTAAFDLLLSFGDGQPPAFRAALFGQVIRKLGYTDQLRMIQRVQFVTEASS
jgi:hypothetical protein